MTENVRAWLPLLKLLKRLFLKEYLRASFYSGTLFIISFKPMALLDKL